MNLKGAETWASPGKKIAILAFALMIMVGSVALVFHGHLHVRHYWRSVRHHLHFNLSSAEASQPSTVMAMPLPERFEASSTDGNETPTLQVGLNGNCIAAQLHGNTFAVAVTARSVLQEDGVPNPLYSKIYHFPRNLLNAKNQITSVPVNLAELKAQRPDLKNLVVAVSVCRDLDESNHCDQTPISQPLRMAGRYFNATSPTGKLNLELISDPNQSSCPKI